MRHSMASRRQPSVPSPARLRFPARCRSRCPGCFQSATVWRDPRERRPGRRHTCMLRDKLLARLAGMGPAPDHQLLAAEVLGIRNASPELARRLVSQALVVEDRREVWRLIGERICAAAPPTPGVYTLRDERGRALYVGKAVNLRRRLRAHFAARRWRAIKADMARAADA